MDFTSRVIAEQSPLLDIALGPEKYLATIESMAIAMLRQSGIVINQIQSGASLCLVR